MGQETINKIVGVYSLLILFIQLFIFNLKIKKTLFCRFVLQWVWIVYISFAHCIHIILFIKQLSSANKRLVLDNLWYNDFK